MGESSAGAARLWARADLRHRWRSIVVLGLIAGITAGLALASFAGARSSGTALDRLRTRTDSSDAIVFASQVGQSHPDWSKLASQPEVRKVAVWALVLGDLDGEPDSLLFTAVDDTWLQSVDKPVIVEGRAFDPDADDEVMVAEHFAHAEGIHVGDTVPFIGYTSDDQEGTAAKDLKGPHLTVRVVGIFRSPLESLFITDGFFAAPPGLLRQHPDLDFHENATVQLAHPERDIPTLEKDASALVAEGAPVLDINAVTRRDTTTTDVERTALLLLGAAIALAGLVLAGQAVARSAGVVGTDAGPLSAMGMRRSSIVLSPVLSHLPAVAVAAASCVATAVAVSPWLPFGLAGQLDPDRGVRLHPEVVLTGTVLLVGLLLLGIAGSAWLAARPPRGDAIEPTRGVAEWIRRHASPTVGLGTTMALRPGRTRGGVPVRPALLGAIVGVLGVATAMTMDAGLRDTLAHPERAGVAWDAVAAPQSEDAYTEHGFAPDYDTALLRAKGVDGAVQLDRAVVQVEGRGLPSFSVRPLGPPSDIQLVTIQGRPPETPGEATIGPRTAKVLGVEVGDTVTVGSLKTPVRIVGLTLFPSDVHSEFDEGLWLTVDDFDVVAPADGSAERYALVRLAPGTSTAEGVASITARTATWEGASLPPELPPELVNLRNVLPLPKLLAAFLALLALAALLHVLATSSRVRAHEFAVLRALGLTRRNTRLVLNVQGTTVFVVGLLLGIPLGVALGRAGWRAIAQSVPLAQVPPFAAIAIAVLVPAALLLAQILAFGPGRRLAHLRPAEVLRAE